MDGTNCHGMQFHICKNLSKLKPLFVFKINNKPLTFDHIMFQEFFIKLLQASKVCDNKMQCHHHSPSSKTQIAVPKPTLSFLKIIHLVTRFVEYNIRKMIHFHCVMNINSTNESYIKFVRTGRGPKCASELNL